MATGGGWDTGKAPLMIDESISSPVATAERKRLSLTDRQRTAAVEYLIHGEQKAAAECMGVTMQTFKNHIGAALGRTGAKSVGHIPYVLGWLVIPKAYMPSVHRDKK